MRRTIFLLSSMGICTTAISGTMGPVQSVEQWYLVGGGGYSVSRDANISVNPLIWDEAKQGYSDDIGSAALLFFGAGKYVTDSIRLDVRAEHRGDYKYSKFQTGISDTPGFTGDVRTRKFKLTSNALMFNGWLDLGNLSQNLMLQTGNYAIQPFIGGGVGVNYSSIHDFHTIGSPFLTGLQSEVPAVNSLTTHSTFAWRAAAGLSASISERSILTVGYNYFDGGNLPFPNYIVSSLSAPSKRSGVTVAPWKGQFRANEVFAELRITI